MKTTENGQPAPVGSGHLVSPSETPRTDAKVVLCNYGEYRVPADFARELERENARLLAQLAECAGIMASVNLERRHRDMHGNLFLNQTLDWGKGCAAIAEKANALLEEHDAL